MRALERVKNSGDQLFREYAGDLKDAKQAKSNLDMEFDLVATKLKKEANYDGSAANLVYSDVRIPCKG